MLMNVLCRVRYIPELNTQGGGRQAKLYFAGACNFSHIGGGVYHYFFYILWVVGLKNTCRPRP